MNITTWGRRSLLGTTMLCAIGVSGAFAQTADTTLQEIIVVGSQVQGSRITDAVPVTVLGQDELQAVAAASGDELFRSIPQMGDVSFNSSYLPNSSNSARGDVGSVNLRNLGVGNTLVLLNGRRVVTHPSSRADENLVPVLTYNTNAIPVNGLQRLEVLRDGAAALYGSDAVAGVVNTVLRTDYEGLTLDAQYGGAEGTGLRQMDLSALLGKNFERGNLTVFASYTDRTALDAQDQDYTRSLDRRPLFVGTRFEGATGLDGRSTVTPWGAFQSAGAVRRNGALVTSTAGLFHVQPTTFAGCATPTSGGLCIDDGAIATAGDDRNLRFDAPAAYNTTVIPEVERINLFLTGNYELTDAVTAFGEVGYYTATTKSLQSSTGTLASLPITMPAASFYNPFGPTTFAGGAVNPNRLSGIDAPAAGRNVTIRTYNFSDAGPTEVDVENFQWRTLAGLRGKSLGFNWEGAILYSKAEVEDISDGISATLLQRQLSLSTPDAYNPFNGANLTNPSLADTARSSQAALDAISIKTVRRNTSSLALVDFKVSRPDLFALPGGDVGMAMGLEYRRETQKDDRDGRVDGTINFTDAVTGTAYTGDLIGTSPSPDTKGARTVSSAFLEFAVPVISPDMNIPLVRSVEMQLAGRFEDFSDAGSIARPKVAVAWDVFDGLRFRGSWAQGFKAPNLEQVNATLVTRSNTRTDFIRCEADLRAGRIASFAACSRAGATTARRAGNQNLQPEESETWGAGVVFEPQFLPSEMGNFIFTLDYWRVKQEGIVGLFGEGNGLILDYLMRTQGSSNPNVVRAAPTSDDVAAFAGTGLTPVGQVLFVNDQYQNLLPQEARGLDFGVAWSLNGTRFGDFSANVNAAHLLRFYRQPSPAIQGLLDARTAGQINPGVAITGGGDLVRNEGRPDWKWSASATWRYEQFTLGAFTQYVGDVEDFGIIDAAGNPWIIDSQVTANLYGQYEFTEGMAANTRLRLGVRNLTDEQPPVATTGYLGELYTPYSRYWYVSVRKTF